jgi:hypothetical protein
MEEKSIRLLEFSVATVSAELGWYLVTRGGGPRKETGLGSSLVLRHRLPPRYQFGMLQTAVPGGDPRDPLEKAVLQFQNNHPKLNPDQLGVDAVLEVTTSGRMYGGRRWMSGGTRK